MKHKFLSYSLFFLSALAPVAMHAQSGACGESVSWSISGGTLTISGEGDMYNNDNSEKFSYAIYSDKIESVVIGDGVTSVGDNAFNGFTNLKSAELPNTVKTIGAQSFCNTGLTDITIPGSVTDLKTRCFSGTALSKIDVPSNVTNVGDDAFSDILPLRVVNWDVDFPFEDIIYVSPFYGDQIDLISFGSNVRCVHNNFMGGVTEGYEIKSSGNIEYVGKGAFDNSRWYYENQSCDVLYFDKCLYHYGSGLNKPTHVIIKDGTTGISEDAFADSRYLTGITVPESVDKIGGTPFSNCPSLNKVEWNAVACATKSGLFNESVSEIVFGDKVVSIPDNMCDGCSSLKSLSFPESLRTIGRYAFSHNSGLEQIKFNESLDSISENAFYGCGSLKSVHLTARVVDGWAFNDCGNVSEININGNVKKIGCYNFNGAIIEKLVLPSTLEKVEPLLLNGHIGKVIIECPDAEKVLESAFGAVYGYGEVVVNNMVFAEGVNTCPYNLNVVDTLEISSTVKKLWSFGNASTLIYKAVDVKTTDYCGSLSGCTNVVIADGVRIIPNGFISGANITTLQLPSSVTEIGAGAFSGISELIKVTAPWYDPREVAADAYAFDGHNEEAELFVPKGRVEEYRNIEPWSGFNIIKEIDGSTEIGQVSDPEIIYEDGALRFVSETPDVKYHYTITDSDIVSDNISDGYVELGACYEISVYASAIGLINSHTTRAKLYFIEANLENSGLLDIPTRRGVLVSTSGSLLTISGLDSNEPVEVYDIAGRLVASGAAADGVCSLNIDSDESVILVRTASETFKVRR